MEIKSCNRCLKTKYLEEFFKDKNHSSGRYSICKECKKQATYKWRDKNRSKYNKAARKWRKDHPGVERKYNLMSKFGINSSDYERMAANQNNVCKICRGSGSRKVLDIDHCHKTQKIRGLLCQSCNVGLGNFQDNVDLLKKAIKYLEGS